MQDVSPEDFVFQLTVEESIVLRCQNGTSNHSRTPVETVATISGMMHEIALATTG